jgi:hypothetical protein
MHLHLMHCTISLLAHVYSYTVDRAEPKSKIQAEQVQWVFGGPQASSYQDANIVVIKASPSACAFNQCSYLFILKLCFMLYLGLCIKL